MLQLNKLAKMKFSKVKKVIAEFNDTGGTICVDGDVVSIEELANLTVEPEIIIYCDPIVNLFIQVINDSGADYNNFMIAIYHDSIDIYDANNKSLVYKQFAKFINDNYRENLINKDLRLINIIGFALQVAIHDTLTVEKMAIKEVVYQLNS
jgi:hypothetical protein